MDNPPPYSADSAIFVLLCISSLNTSSIQYNEQHFPTQSVTPFTISFSAWLHLQELFAPQLMSNWKPLALFLWHLLVYDWQM
jgi:hypothetical protein